MSSILRSGEEFNSTDGSDLVTGTTTMAMASNSFVIDEGIEMVGVDTMIDIPAIASAGHYSQKILYSRCKVIFCINR